MTGAHTPGPWHVEDGANSHCFDGRLMAGDDCIAFVDIGTPDAALIAAAPMLLKGAQDTVEALKLIRIGLANSVIDEPKMIEVIDAHIDELSFAISHACLTPLLSGSIER